MAKFEADGSAPSPELRAAIARSATGLKDKRTPSRWTSFSLICRNVLDRFVAGGHECQLPGGPHRWREAETQDSLSHAHKFQCPECGARYVRKGGDQAAQVEPRPYQR